MPAVIAGLLFLILVALVFGGPVVLWLVGVVAVLYGVVWAIGALGSLLSR